MQITTLRVDQIHAGNNPRSTFSDDSLAELAASIGQDGVLEPIRVVKNDDGFRLESGERRFRAAQLAGLTEIPAIITSGSSTDEYVRALVTNLQREDMNVIDEARAYRALLDKHGLTTSGVAERLGVAQSRVTQRLELLDLPASLLQLYYEGKLRLDCRRVFRDIALVSEALCELTAKTVAGKDEWGAVLAQDPLRVLAFVAKDSKEFFVLPGRIERKALKLRKAQEEAAAKLDSQWSEWTPHFTEEDIAVAASVGVAFTHKDSDSAVVVSREWLRDHFDVVLKRRVEQIEKAKAETARAEANAKASKMNVGDLPPEEAAEVEKQKEYGRQQRQAIADAKVAARAANLELGRALFSGLKPVTSGVDKNVAEVLVAAAIGHRTSDLFLSGLRYCLPEFQSENDKGKVTYVSAVVEAGEKCHAWLKAAESGDELIRRALILLLASKYADEGCVAQSERRGGLYDPSPHVGSKEIPVLQLLKPLGQIAKTAVPAASRGTSTPSQKVIAKFEKAWAQAHSQDAGE